MSKNISRKGIAFGVAATVGFAGLTGALPAQAVVPVSLSPNGGTSYGMLLGQEFELKSVFTDAAQDNSESLTFKIVDSTGSLSTGAFGEAVATNTWSYTEGDPQGDPSVPVVENVLSLEADGDVEDTFSVAVTAFLDFNNDGILQTSGDEAEVASATRTVTFYAQDEVTSTVSITQPYEGDTSVEAAVKFTNINNEQFDATDLALVFSKGTGATLAGAEVGEGYVEVDAWDATDGFVASSGEITGLGANKLVKVQAVNGLGAAAFPEDIDAADKIGSAKTAKALEVIADTITASTVASKTANLENKALTNGEFQVSALVEDENDDAVAGNKVHATIYTDVTLSSEVKLVVNGVTYTDNDDLPGADGVAEIATTSNAKGIATVTLKTIGFDEGQVVSTDFTTENLLPSTVRVTLQDADYSIYEANDVAELAEDGNYQVATTSGSRFNLNLLVSDQFGGVPASGKYEARLALDSAGDRTEQANHESDVNVSFVSGKASVSVADTGSGLGTDSYVVELFNKADNELFDSLDVDVHYVAAADLVAGEISVVDGSGDDREANDAGIIEIDATEILATEDFSNFDSRTLSGTQPNIATSEVVIAGTIATAGSDTEESVAVIGATVTISGEGLLFESAGNYSVGSLTVRADDEGNYDFNVWSHKAGEQTVTIRSGSKSQKVIIEFDQAGPDAGTTIAFTSSNQVKAGRTLTVKGLLTDKFGNPVATEGTDFEAVYDGPGFILSDDVNATDANGKFSIKVLLGTGEVGSASVTAKYDVDGALDAADGNDNRITKTQTILLGVSAASVAGSKKVVSTVKNASGLQVKVYVDGKLKATKTASSDNYSVAVSKLTVGKHTVKVYVAGILVNTKSVVVKK